MAESLIGSIVNGQYTKTTASTDATNSDSTVSTSKTATNEGTAYNEEMFLQLLVAEMQYQDPLEPTDNGEYVSQLASFTQIEAIQSVQADMKSIQATSLVGQAVSLNVDNEEVYGIVDFVRSDDDGEMYLSIDGEEYSLDDLISVIDNDYYSDALMATTAQEAILKLPSASDLTLSDEEDVAAVTSLLSSMSERSLNMIDSDTTTYYQKVVTRMNELIKASESADTDSESSSESEDSTEETEG